MRFEKKSALVAALSATLALSACGGQGEAPSPVTGGQELTGWTEPTCRGIIGTNAVTFTKDEGATLATTRPVLSGVAYTLGLVALDTPNTLLASHANTLLKSTDAGCSWSSIGTLPASLTLTAAPGGRAYAWALNGSSLYRVDGSTVTALSAPVANVFGLGVDPANGSHVRVGGRFGQLYESFDGGATWTTLGVPATSGDVVIDYVVAFDPANIDHVLYGRANEGAFVTTNGGATWTRSQLGSTNLNAFSIVVSPANGQVVWLEGKDLTSAADLRQLFRSTDGGLTFTSVFTETATVKMTNGILLAPHPTNTDVVFFEFGTHYNNYGTDIYKYNHATGGVTMTHNANDDVSSIAFSPANPSVMYFGLTSTDV